MAAPSCEGPAASPGETGGCLDMDLGEMDCFKERALEIVRKSRNPVRCLQVMRAKAVSILDVCNFLGEKVCSSPEFSYPLQEAMEATSEVIQTCQDARKEDATAFV